MKTSSLLAILATLTAAFCLTGCDTFKSRAEEKSAVFDALPPKTQKRLEHGRLKVGDTPDMTYIALGDPDEKRENTTAKGTKNVWIYKTYWEQYEGTEWGGWHRVIVPTGNGQYMIYHEPIERNVYSQHMDEVIRVTFVDGKVTELEQHKR